MKLNWSFRLSRWAVASIFFLTFSYLVSLVHSQWLPVFAYQPFDVIYSCKRLTPLTFSLVTDEHVTHWLTILAILIMDKLIWDCWSKWETFIFVLVVNLGSIVLTTFSLKLFGEQPGVIIVGNTALIASVTVISAQFDPDRYLLGYGKIGLRSRYGFCCGLVIFFLFSLIGLTRWTSFLMFINGFFVSWFYLRFLQHHPQRKYGDHRASFALAKFFPEPLEPWVALPCNVIYTLVLRSRLCPGVERQSEIVSTASFAVNIPGLTSDMERHRRLALRILNERLQSNTGDKSTTNRDDSTDWPDLSESDLPPSGPRDSDPVDPVTATHSVLVHLPQTVDGSTESSVNVALPTGSETQQHVV